MAHGTTSEKAGALVEGGRFRVETDSMGAVRVPAERLWGAQTQRSLHHFSIGDDRMPTAVYRAYGIVKKAAARVNAELGRLPADKAKLIDRAADEVIADRAIQLAGGTLGTQTPVHPNDHVNMSQSSNDTFPAAMHVATVLELANHLIPSIEALVKTLWSRARQWAEVVKIGRTHLQDATPLTVGQEWSGYATQMEDALAGVREAMKKLYPLATGGTAVGTGITAPADFGDRIAKEIARQTGHPFVSARNKFAAIGSLDPMVAVSAALRGVAVPLIKIANDIRWLGCGPRAGIHELNLPANEPGSSIMPGKVNPTQEEAVVMVGIQVIGNDTAVAFAGSQGNFELNAMRPIILYNVLHSSTILADVCDRWREHSLEQITLDRARIDRYVGESLMLVTALSPVIGYDKAAHIAHEAHQKGITLREAALASGDVTAEQFDKVVVPRNMVGNPRKDVGLE